MPLSFPVIIGKKIESLISSEIPGPLSIIDILHAVAVLFFSIISPCETRVIISIFGEVISDSMRASLAFLTKLRIINKDRPVYIYILFINIALWVFTEIILGGTTRTLLSFGANYGPYVKNGDTWRLITSVFLVNFL